MTSASKYTPVPPHFAVWNSYDKTAKVDFFSTAIQTNGGKLVLLDPMSPTNRWELDVIGPVDAVILTNANHVRASQDFVEKNHAPIFARAELPGSELLQDGQVVHDLLVIAIDGAAAGEIALYDQRDGGTVCFGDAVINLGGTGFGLLPTKYCSDRKQMIRSVRILLDLPFRRIFFAHGEPIVSRGRERLANLLGE